MIGIHKYDLSIYITPREIERLPDERLEGRLLNTVPETSEELRLTAETSPELKEQIKTETGKNEYNIILSDYHYRILQKRGWTGNRNLGGGAKTLIYNREELDPLETVSVSRIEDRLNEL